MRQNRHVTSVDNITLAAEAGRHSEQKKKGGHLRGLPSVRMLTGSVKFVMKLNDSCNSKDYRVVFIQKAACLRLRRYSGSCCWVAREKVGRGSRGGRGWK